jgi:hypothetical protein
MAAMREEMLRLHHGLRLVSERLPLGPSEKAQHSADVATDTVESTQSLKDRSLAARTVINLLDQVASKAMKF